MDKNFWEMCFKIGNWAIEHEDEILEQLPPEEQVETILATKKMKQGREGIAKFINYFKDKSR